MLFKQDFDGKLMDLITLFNPYNSFQPYVSNKLLNDSLTLFYAEHDFCTLECIACVTVKEMQKNVTETLQKIKKPHYFISLKSANKTYFEYLDT